MKILVEKAVVEQALGALEIYGEHAKDCPQWPTYTRPQDYPKCDCGFEEAITALRKALMESNITEHKLEQEPVAIIEKEAGFETEVYATGHADSLPDGVFKLYASPVRTKDLTDEELWEAAKTAKSNDLTDAFRAVIAKFKEVNNL